MEWKDIKRNMTWLARVHSNEEKILTLFWNYMLQCENFVPIQNALHFISDLIEEQKLTMLQTALSLH